MLADNAPPKSGPQTALIRFLGIAIIAGGLFSAVQVVEKAWSLLDKPDSITALAEEIESQAHLNAFVNQLSVVVDFMNKAKAALPQLQPPQGQAPAPAAEPQSAAVVAAPINASFFAAWIIVVVLLGLIAKISLWAVTSGVQLATYGGDSERQLKMVLRELLQEVRRGRLN
jgi:hypothetical protein